MNLDKILKAAAAFNAAANITGTHPTPAKVKYMQNVLAEEAC